METAFNIALGIHIVSILGILGLLLSQVTKSPRKIKSGVIHSGLTALVSGIVMVGFWSQANPDEELNHGKIGVKALALALILFLGYANVKEDEVKTWVWGSMLGLTTFNIIIAVGI